MSKVLFLYERNMPTVSIIQGMFKSLKKEYGIDSYFIRTGDVKTKDIERADILVFIRPNDMLSPEIAKCAKASGHFIITLCDDDLLHLPLGVPCIPWRKSGLLKTLETSDAIMSSSKYICDKYKAHTISGRYAVVNTIISENEIKVIESDICNQDEEKLIKIVYAANPGHITLFNRYILPIMPELVKKYEGKISLTFVGVRPNLEEYKTRLSIHYKAGMNLREYRKYMLNGKFDIGLAPLNTDDFSKCKYFNKYLEYTMVGVAGIYTDAEPYTQVIKNGENGFLTENNKESWLKTLSFVIEHPKERKKCVEAAQKDLRDNFTEKEIITQLLYKIPELKIYDGKLSKCKGFLFPKMFYNFFRVLDWIYLLNFYLWHGGVKKIQEKAKIHFRESKTYK